MKTTVAKPILMAAALIAAPAPSIARDGAGVVQLINAFRAMPATCDGRAGVPLPPLNPHPALAGVQVGTGLFLDQVLDQAGYPVARAEAIHVSGPLDAAAVMAAIETPYCRTLRSTAFAAIGAGRSGNSWTIVLAQPAPPSPIALLPGIDAAARAILDAVNTARAGARRCGERSYPAAPPLALSGALGAAALVHSTDMAKQRYLKHQGKDGRTVGERATQAGYRWRVIGENIAAGQETTAEAVASWLDSPGHCANIMNPQFSEMGAAYGVNARRENPRIYWTQVFGAPR